MLKRRKVQEIKDHGGLKRVASFIKRDRREEMGWEETKSQRGEEIMERQNLFFMHKVFKTKNIYIH